MLRYDSLDRFRAAFFAAADRLPGPLVRAASFAAADFSACVRRRALPFACFANADRDAAPPPSRFSTPFTAFDTRGRRFGRRLPCPTSYARSALFRDFSETRPFFGGGSFTPARRAFDNPIAIACFADFAPCFPSRMW